VTVPYDHNANLMVRFYVQYILIYSNNSHEKKWHSVPVPDMSTALVVMKVTPFLQRVN
jgi:hypothetical protein